MDINLNEEQVSFILKKLDDIERLSNLPLTISEVIMDIKMEIDPVYCSTCSSCGELGYCPPDKCNSLYNLLNFTYLESYLLEKERLYFGANGEINRPNLCSHMIEELRVRFQASKSGLYCDYNIKTYYEMQKELNELSDSCKALFECFDIIEVTDDGREFRPNYINSCRVSDTINITKFITDIKRIIR